MKWRLFLAGGCVALLSGCDALEPYQRADTWHPAGIGASNLAAMVADPEDLVHGRGTEASDGATAAAAVDRLRHDHVKALSTDNSSSNSTPSPAAGLSGS